MIWLDEQGGTVVPRVAERVRELVADGATDADLAEALEVSERTAKRVRLALGLGRRATPAALVPDQVLRRLHAEGLTTREIAERTGLTPGSVSTRMSRLGLRANRAR